MSLLLRLLCCLLSLAVLSGCMGSGGGSLFSQPDPAKRFYALQTERTAMACAAGKRNVLKIRRSNIASVYSSRELVYRTGPNEYKSDYYHVFLVSPQDMITESILEWFSGSGMFTQVVPGTSALRPDYVLESSVPRLYGDFSGSGPAKAVVEIQFFLLEDELAEFKVVFCNDYTEEVPLADRTPPALVAGMEQGLQTILERLERDMGQALNLAAAPEGAAGQ